MGAAPNRIIRFLIILCFELPLGRSLIKGTAFMSFKWMIFVHINVQSIFYVYKKKTTINMCTKK